MKLASTLSTTYQSSVLGLTVMGALLLPVSALAVDKQPEPRLRIEHRKITTAQTPYELTLPEGLGGAYLVFAIKPLAGDLPPGELYYVPLAKGWQGARVVGSLDLGSEHATDANGKEVWYKLTPGKYQLSVAVYSSKPFVGTGMQYVSPKPKAKLVIPGPVVTIPGAIVKLR